MILSVLNEFVSAATKIGEIPFLYRWFDFSYDNKNGIHRKEFDSAAYMLAVRLNLSY